MLHARLQIARALGQALIQAREFGVNLQIHREELLSKFPSPPRTQGHSIGAKELTGSTQGATGRIHVTAGPAAAPYCSGSHMVSNMKNLPVRIVRVGRKTQIPKVFRELRREPGIVLTDQVDMLWLLIIEDSIQGFKPRPSQANGSAR